MDTSLFPTDLSTPSLLCAQELVRQRAVPSWLHLGIGTVDMLKRCRKAGMRSPEFRVDSGFFVLTIWRKRIVAAEWQAEQWIESGPSGDQVGTKLKYCIRA